MLIERNSTSEHRDASFLLADKVYPVYAVLFDSSIQYLVSEENSFSFPFFVASQAVNLIDTRVPDFMHLSPALLSTEECSSRVPMVGFFEIVTDRFFYQRLVDGEMQATLVWNELKASIGKTADNNSQQ